MKNVYLMLLLCTIAAQSQTKNYTTTTDYLTNPERGFYRYQSTGSGNYEALSLNTLNIYRNTDKITLVWREFYLSAFRTSPISADYLSKMQADFNTVRSAGLKCIVRFCYSESGSNDASKAQILAHIAQLKPIMLANEDVVSSMEAGFIGDWGEWYYSNHFGQDNLTAQNIADRLEVGLKIMELTPNRMVAFRTPIIQKQIAGSTALTASAAYNGSTKARVAAHNDCFLSSADDWGTYNSPSDYTYLETQSKYTFDGGETCSLTTFSACGNAIATMAKYHFNYLNIDYSTAVINNWKSNGCYDEVKRRLGYRFELVSSTIANNSITINVKNEGFGNVINDRKAFLVLRNTTTAQEYSFQLNTNVRLWNAASTTQIVQDLGLAVPAGNYQLFLNLPDLNLPTNSKYSIQCGNTGVWDSTKGYNNLDQTVTIGSGSGSGPTPPPPPPSPVVAPVDILLISNVITPFNLPNPNFTVKVYNSNGRLKSLNVNISHLRNGVYIVKLTCLGVVYTKSVLKQ